MPYSSISVASSSLAGPRSRRRLCGQWHDGTLGAMTFQEFVGRDWLPSRHIDATTRAAYVSNLTKHFFPHFGHRPIARIPPDWSRTGSPKPRPAGSPHARSASTTRCCTRPSNEPSATSSSSSTPASIRPSMVPDRDLDRPEHATAPDDVYVTPSWSSQPPRPPVRRECSPIRGLSSGSAGRAVHRSFTRRSWPDPPIGATVRDVPSHPDSRSTCLHAQSAASSSPRPSCSASPVLPGSRPGSRLAESARPRPRPHT